MTTSTRRRPGEEGEELSELHERWDVTATPQVWIPRGDDIATYEREQRQRARQDLGRTRRGMGQAGEKREESARGEGGLGLRAAAEAWGMGPLTALHYTAVLRSVELCSAVLFLVRCIGFPRCQRRPQTDPRESTWKNVFLNGSGLKLTFR